ncbi:hypothetical protein Dsin_012816 [Dipteronia sinensis]|uniref:Uncharacterized protein n=1 Tax=Dipteronia sinensis TaxID=43782 RepID=A0AAE0AIR0_9ROSI|nr:hypothetical protein Dsin_012816 [Dipteronia sinensis]
MKGPIADISKVARRQDTILPNGSNGIAGMGIMKVLGLRKSTELIPDVQEVWLDQHMKIQGTSKLWEQLECELKRSQYFLIGGNGIPVSEEEIQSGQPAERPNYKTSTTHCKGYKIIPI